MRDLNHILTGALAFALAATACARDLDPDLRQQVIASCNGDAMRLCPQSLGNESEAVSCMRKKRRDLTPVCRAAYDQAVRVLAQK